MDSRALINETLKYLEKNENGQPKYRFDIYRSGITQQLNRATSLLTGGAVTGIASTDDSAVPVVVYTIGDIFNTVRDTSGDVMKTISALPSTLDNIKSSLKQLGFNALDSTLNTMKAAVVPIQVVQTINDVYRIARPLVEKVVDIASIMFHFENAAKVAQDVLQYITRLGVSTARNYLTRLFDILMDTPVFAVYENDNTVSLSAAYSFLSSEADEALDTILNSEDTFNEIINYANTMSSKRMYEPGYNNLGISIPEDIVDVYSDPDTRNIFIASENKIYHLNDDYTVTKITDTTVDIDKVFTYDGNVYYSSGNNIYKAGDDSFTWSITSPVIVYSNPVLIYSGNDSSGNFYNPDKTTAFSATLKYFAFDHERKILYFVDNSNNLMMAEINELGNFQTPEELGPVGEIYGLAYFNDILYSIKKSSDNKYYVSKINAGIGFQKTTYAGVNSIIYLNDDVATNGSYVYTRSGSSFTLINKSSGAINSVIKQTYKGKQYLIATGGTDVNITFYNSNNLSWFNKSLNSNGIPMEDGSEDSEVIPDNLSGCIWFNGQAGNTLVLNSQSNIYVVANSDLDELLRLPDPDERIPLNYKNFRTLNEWFDDRKEKPDPVVNCTAKFTVDEGCIITKIKKLNNKLYVALFNPDSNFTNGIKSGVYELVISHLTEDYNININYSNPVYTVSDENHKIYSFDFFGDELYFTDGKKLLRASSSSESDLNIEQSDGALDVVNESGILKIYTSTGVLTKQTASSMGDISTSVNYKSSDVLSVASTENILMISDGQYIYNIVDNGDDAIKNELFQICYTKGTDDFSLLHRNNAAFIVSGNSIKKVPLYDSISSSDYGCGYYTDTTPNKWMGAAPYYFASNVIKNNKNKRGREIFIRDFKENFKVELEKLLRYIPDAFVEYTKDKLVEELTDADLVIEGDDGQIANLMINSVSSTAANSIGMYVYDKFMEKIGDDTTYNTFAQNVYQACVEDLENNMTDDFYKIFSELYRSTITEAITQINLGEGGLSEFLLRYYQNHKAEWAQSMTDLIDIDIVDPDYYEIPLKDSEHTFEKETYVFDYDTASYAHKYTATPAKDYDEVIKGYYVAASNAFYADASHTEVIDQRIFSSTTQTWSLNGELICYKNPADNKLYRFKIEDYALSTASSAASGVTYYQRNDESYDYVLTTDTTESKIYYEPDEYVLSSSSSVITGVGYYEKTGSDETIYTAASAASGALSLGVAYYVKSGYVPTSDTAIAASKIYYERSYVNASSVETGTQYYKIDYVPTSDITIDSSKTYYEYIDLSGYTGEEIFIPAPSGTTAQKYNVNFKPFGLADYTFNGTYYTYDVGSSDYPRYNVTFVADANGSYIASGGHFVYNPSSESTKYSVSVVTQPNYIFDENTVYYTYSDGQYVVAETLDLQYGPYYYADGFTASSSGTYIKTTISAGTTYYSQVTAPQINNLPSYYEQGFVAITYSEASSLTADKRYKIDYISVASPDITEIGSYYEVSEDYVLASDMNYIYDSDGNAAAVKADRDYYIASTIPLKYNFVSSMASSASPVEEGWYEASTYSELLAGSTDNPLNDHLYERRYTPTSFTIVSSMASSASPAASGWYEYDYSYVTPYTESKIYIDLEPVTVTSNFKDLDDSWHNSFYTAASEAASSVTSSEIDIAKTQALNAINDLNFPYPDWKWEDLINESVTELYIPKQGEQFREIVMDSNMYPIRWEELPSEISRDSFEYALNTLLYMIKQRLLTNITILVDGGKVKCFSCVDASTVIKKIVNRNYVIWRNQIRSAKSKIEKATSVEGVKAVFNMVKAYDETIYLLENILNDQSRLYARYIDQLIEEQIINDNETEVTL